MSPPKPIRLPLDRGNQRLPFEGRTLLCLVFLALPAVVLGAAATWLDTRSLTLAWIVAAALAVLYSFAIAFFFEQLIRPLQTLSNVVASLREGDFSFRACAARRGDALGELALEINSLAVTLQQQGTTALDALTLVERVLGSMQSPVLAFDASGQLRLINAAARRQLGLNDNAVGKHASRLQLQPLLEVPDQGLYSPDGTHATRTRWSVRRSSFRPYGLPHTLLLLTDVSAALREEERLAWQRLIRVLSHEINNSLTPIHSIAGNLRSRLNSSSQPVDSAYLRRGLTIIEDRSVSLNRFLQAYQRLARLPAPTLILTNLAQLLAQVALLETRLVPELRAGTPVTLLCDPDQIQQALINLIQNAADSALSRKDEFQDHKPHVILSWALDGGSVIISVEDNGLGIINSANLFVPFYTTKPNGSGVGLALAQQIATAHQGSISVRSNDGRSGCRAQLILPIR